MHSDFVCIRGRKRIIGTEYNRGGEGKLPIAIVSHEFMLNRLFSKRYARLLAKAGYAAFCYDFCGGGVVSHSEGKRREMSVLTELEDLSAVVEYAKSLPYTDENRVLLMGCSQGGLVSALYASRHPENIEKLVLFYPALSIPDDARKGNMMMARFDVENIPKTFRCGPMLLGRCYVEDALSLDPYADMTGYKGNVLLLHGDADKIVDIEYSRRAEKTYLECGARVRFEEISGAGHIFFNPAHDRLAKQYLKEFLNSEG